jgi:hypothetical protein
LIALTSHLSDKTPRKTPKSAALGAFSHLTHFFDAFESLRKALIFKIPTLASSI